MATRRFGVAITVAGVGAFTLAIGAIGDADRVASAYLVAWVYWLSLALGALLLVMIHHLTGSTWFIVLRRVAERAFSPIVPLAVLAVPLGLSIDRLYPWTHPATLDAHLRSLVEEKSAWLDPTFFVLRAIVYLGIWLVVAVLLTRWSTAQDRGGDGDRLALRQKRLCAITIPAVALALTFASFDWVMSLSPEWSSSVFGVYIFAGCAVSGVSLLIVLCYLCQRAGRLRDVVTVSHYHGMGKLLFTFVVFWTYIAFFQLFVIWIANVPEEASWYVTRERDGWAFVSLVLFLGHFVLPFFLLLSRDLKRRPERLVVVAGWLLAMHFVDVYWMIMPSSTRAGFAPDWLDAAAFLAVGGLVVAWALWQSAGAVDTAKGDPRFERSLRFETH